MCLYTFRSKPKIARKDIVCYKQVILQGLKRYPKYATFFQHMDVTENIMSGMPLSTRDESESVYDVDESKYPEIDSLAVFFASMVKSIDFLSLITLHEVNGGFIHTWQDARGLVAMGDVRTYECVIPKGTPYYKGLEGDYASKEIRFVKCINGRAHA